MYTVRVALALLLPYVAVQGEQDCRSDACEDADYTYDADPEDNLTTTEKPKHHVHPLVMESNLNYTDLCQCFSGVNVSKDCRQRYPENLRTMRNGSTQMAYETDNKSLVNSRTLPLIIISSGEQTTLKIADESLVLLCATSIGSSLEHLEFSHISRLHINGQILKNRSTPIHLRFSSITTPIKFHEGSLKLVSSKDDSKSTTVSLSFQRCSEVVFESKSVVAPDLFLNSEYVNHLKFDEEAITLTSRIPLTQLRVKGERQMKLTMETNSIIYGALEMTADGCGNGTAYSAVELESLGEVSLAENALKLLPCSNLTLRMITLSHTGPNALTNVPRTMLNWAHIKQVEGNGGLAPGSICLMATTVWAGDNQISLESKDEEYVMLLSGKSVKITGSTTGVRICEQQNTEVQDMESSCQICQIKTDLDSTLTKELLPNKKQTSTTFRAPTTVISTTGHPPTQELWYHDKKIVILYLVLAASIIAMAIILGCIIHAIKKSKKRNSWNVPSLPWAKSHHNSRHPALAAKAAYSASQNISGKPECYTIFDSIAAARQVKQTKTPLQNVKENPLIEEKQDEQECTYSEPVDTLSRSRRHSHVYAYPSNIKGGEGSLHRYSSLSDRRLSASTASVASSIADLNMISALSTQDRRKSSYGLLIDITSALGIESNYKQLTNK